MKLNFKLVLCILVSSIMLISGTACNKSDSSSDGNNSDGSDTPKKVVTLKLTMFVDHYQQGWQAIEEDVNSNSTALGFKLNIDKIAGGDQGLQIMKARAATGDLPDVLAFVGTSAMVTDLRILDKLIDFSDAPWVNNYEKDVLIGNYGYDGKVHGIPYGGTSIPGVFYNKKIFNELGLSIPNTWSEFLNVCEEIKTRKPDVTPYFVAGKDAWTVQIFNIMGLQRELRGKDPAKIMKDLNDNKISIESLKLFEDSYVKYLELKNKGYFQTNWLSDSYDAQQKAIAEGTAAMTTNATWMIDEIVKKYPDQINDIGAFTIPFDGEDPLGAWVPAAVYGINTSKNVEAVKSFMNYFGSLETQKKYFNAQPGIPVVKGIEVGGIPSAAKDLYDLFSKPGRGQTNWQVLNKMNVGAFDNYSMEVLVGAKTPQQVLTAIRKEMEKDGRTRGLPEWSK